jgi:hypothetical protein
MREIAAVADVSVTKRLFRYTNSALVEVLAADPLKLLETLFDNEPFAEVAVPPVKFNAVFAWIAPSTEVIAEDAIAKATEVFMEPPKTESAVPVKFTEWCIATDPCAELSVAPVRLKVVPLNGDTVPVLDAPTVPVSVLFKEHNSVDIPDAETTPDKSLPRAPCRSPIVLVKAIPAIAVCSSGDKLPSWIIELPPVRALLFAATKTPVANAAAWPVNSRVKLAEISAVSVPVASAELLPVIALAKDFDKAPVLNVTDVPLKALSMTLTKDPALEVIPAPVRATSVQEEASASATYPPATTDCRAVVSTKYTPPERVNTGAVGISLKQL